MNRILCGFTIGLITASRSSKTLSRSHDLSYPSGLQQAGNGLDESPEHNLMVLDSHYVLADY